MPLIDTWETNLTYFGTERVQDGWIFHNGYQHWYYSDLFINIVGLFIIAAIAFGVIVITKKICAHFKKIKDENASFERKDAR